MSPQIHRYRGRYAKPLKALGACRPTDLLAAQILYSVHCIDHTSRRIRANTIVGGIWVLISNFVLVFSCTLCQISLKLGGCLSYAKIALEPRPHAQENSESPAIFIFVCRSWCTGEGEFEQFSEFLAGKSCSKLKSKQGGFFRLALAVRTKKNWWNNSHGVKSYSTFTAHV